jgi:SAM-dependent methyltransferase
MDQTARTTAVAYQPTCIYSAKEKMELANSLRILQIGAGKRKIRGATTVDINPRVRPDIVWDLNEYPYPLADDSFNAVVCEHVLEHLENVIGVMEELHRVTLNGGRVYIRVPHYTSYNFNTDPTHVHSFSSSSFDYICTGTELSQYDYSPLHFRKLYARMTTKSTKPINLLLMRLMNANLEFYERHLAYIIPGHELTFVLEVVK